MPKNAEPSICLIWKQKPTQYTQNSTAAQFIMPVHYAATFSICNSSFNLIVIVSKMPSSNINFVAFLKCWKTIYIHFYIYILIKAIRNHNQKNIDARWCFCNCIHLTQYIASYTNKWFWLCLIIWCSNRYIHHQ